MVFLKNKFKELKFEFIRAALKRGTARYLFSHSQQKALQTFNRACGKNYYQKILRKRNAPVAFLSSLNEFQQQVPTIDKKDVFDPSSGIIPEILLSLKPEDKQALLLSSGTSGQFAFGHMPYRAQGDYGLTLEVLLHEYFQILKQKTLIVNTFAQVKLPALTGVCADIGPRADCLHYVLKTLAPNFDQTIVIGDNLFLKNALEDGINAGINYKSFKIALILGGVYLPENLRSYLSQILMTSASADERIYSSMGISEFGLNLFFESPETIELRRQIAANADLRKKLCPSFLPNYLPVAFNYLPQNYFLETIDDEIIVTALGETVDMPLLVRYNTHDTGHLIEFDQLESILKEFGLAKLLPPFKSPLVLLYGRTQKKEGVCIEIIQDQLWSDFDLCSKTTGLFKVIPEASSIKIHLQLKRGVVPTPHLTQKYQDLLSSAVTSPLSIELILYQDFSYAIDLDFQKKFQYI